MQAPVVIHRCSGASCCHDPQNALGWKKLYPAAMQARCCCDHRMLWCKKVCYPALPCKLAAVVIHRNALVQGRVCYPCAVMHAAAVVIHRMLWWRKGCLSCAAMQARCCHDPQNLWWKKVCYPCAAMQARCCCDSQNALVEEGVLSLLPCKLAAVVIHRMLWWKKGVLLSQRCHACKLLS
jgi:hypothetical protein